MMTWRGSLKHWTVLEVHPVVDTLALDQMLSALRSISWLIGMNPCSFTAFQWWRVIVIGLVIVIVIVIYSYRESVSRQSIVIVLACYSFTEHPAPPMVPTNPGFPLKKPQVRWGWFRQVRFSCPLNPMKIPWHSLYMSIKFPLKYH